MTFLTAQEVSLTGQRKLPFFIFFVIFAPFAHFFGFIQSLLLLLKVIQFLFDLSNHQPIDPLFFSFLVRKMLTQADLIVADTDLGLIPAGVVNFYGGLYDQRAVIVQDNIFLAHFLF